MTFIFRKQFYFVVSGFKIISRPADFQRRQEHMPGDATFYSQNVSRLVSPLNPFVSWNFRQLLSYTTANF
jgi:hypothetical protein